eukprot:9422124-Alexandrium_andersonii.AAC.1
MCIRDRLYIAARSLAGALGRALSSLGAQPSGPAAVGAARLKTARTSATLMSGRCSVGLDTRC